MFPVLVLAAALAMTPTPAYAGIEAMIGAQIFAFLAADIGLSVTASLALTSAITTLGPLALLGGAALLLTPKTPSSIDPGQARQTFENASAPELRAVGRARLGGLKAFGNTVGNDRYRLIFHCRGLIDGFETFYLAGREVIVQPSDGKVVSRPWLQGDGSTTYAYLKTSLGPDDKTAWADLVAAFPALWTSDHRARGIAQTLAKFVNPGLGTTDFLALYQSGPPELEVVVRAESEVYDPRIDDEQWTENGILNALHILLSYPERSLDDIDLEFVADEADRADAVVATRAGNVARSRCCGVWSSESARGENLQRVLDSIGAWIVQRDGGSKIGLQLIDDDPTAEMTIPLRHITKFSWKAGPDGVERPNRCRLKYYSPERNYELAEVDLSGVAWANIQDEIDAYGEKPLEIELPFCPNAGQAQRRARQMFALARSNSGTIKTNMAGLAVWGCRIVNFEFPDDLGTIKCLIGAPKVLDGEGEVEIPFRVWPSLPAWNTSTDEVDAPDQIPEIALGEEKDTPDTPAEATVVQYPAGDYETRVRYTVPADAAGGEVEFAYRTYNARDLPNAWLPMVEEETTIHFAHVPLDLRGERGEFRLRTYEEGNSSKWSPLFNVPSLAINNAAPSAPSSAMVGADKVAVAPNSLNVAYLRVNGGSPIPVWPGQTTTTVVLVGHSIVAYSSNGTASTAHIVL